MSYKVSYYNNSSSINIDDYVRSDDPDDDFNDIEIDVILQKSLKEKEDLGLVETIFPTLHLAEMYAKNILGAKISECNINVAPVEVKKIDVGFYSNNLSLPTGKMQRMNNKVMIKSKTGELI
jgi:hypothetical protein